jgi:hypothetical protein
MLQTRTRPGPVGTAAGARSADGTVLDGHHQLRPVGGELDLRRVVEGVGGEAVLVRIQTADRVGDGGQLALLREPEPGDAPVVGGVEHVDQVLVLGDAVREPLALRSVARRDHVDELERFAADLEDRDGVAAGVGHEEPAVVGAQPHRVPGAEGVAGEPLAGPRSLTAGGEGVDPGQLAVRGAPVHHDLVGRIVGVGGVVVVRADEDGPLVPLGSRRGRRGILGAGRPRSANQEPGRERGAPG